MHVNNYRFYYNIVIFCLGIRTLSFLVFLDPLGLPCFRYGISIGISIMLGIALGLGKEFISLNWKNWC